MMAGARGRGGRRFMGGCMDKKSAMAKVNEHLGYSLLVNGNTSLANVNSAKDVWWFNISPRKFERDLHIILVKEKDSGLIWLRIKGNSIPTPTKVFTVRQDNGYIDLEISSRPPYYMTDVKGGGKGYDFSRHIEYEWEFAEGKASAEGDIQATGGIQIELEQETDGRWIAEAPEIPGVLVYGATTDEAIANVQALALRVLAERIEHGESARKLVSGWFRVV